MPPRQQHYGFQTIRQQKQKQADREQLETASAEKQELQMAAEKRGLDIETPIR